MNFIINKLKQMSEGKQPYVTTNTTITLTMGECPSKRQKTESTEKQQIFYFVKNKGKQNKKGVFYGEKDDHIAFRFQIIKALGSGAFGVCYLVYDHKTKQECALKIIRKEERFQRQAKKEYQILKTLLESDSSEDVPFIHMIEYMVFDGHPIFTFKVLGDNLYSILKSGGFRGFPQKYTHLCGIDILNCLERLLALKIIHADLKPENILVKPSDDGVKVIDFGSSCFSHQKTHTYIQSRYYRAPEIVLGCGYDCAIDMWSLGCILVELDSGEPLFPAIDQKHLIILIFEILGMPTGEFLKSSRCFNKYFGKDKPLDYYYKGKLYTFKRHTIQDACKTKDAVFIDFISKCLTWDPKERMTPEQALQHPYITKQQPVILVPIARSDDTYEEEPEFPLLP